MSVVSTQREDVWFNSGSDRISAWLYRPESDGSDAAVPLLVMAHGLGAVRTMRLDTRLDLLAARHLYTKHSYREVPPFRTDNPYSQCWYAKQIS